MEKGSLFFGVLWVFFFFFFLIYWAKLVRLSMDGH